MAQLVVGVIRRQLQLKNKPINLVDDKHNRQLLLQGMDNEALCVGENLQINWPCNSFDQTSVHHDTLHRVNDKDTCVGDTERGSNLIGKVDVPC